MASAIQSTTENKQDIAWWLDDLQRVQHFVAPAWPLRDLVAVNPFHDVADLNFQQVRDRLATVKSGDLLPPLSYFQERFDQGEFSIHHVEAAFQQCGAADNESVQWQDVSYALMDDDAQQADSGELKVRTIAASVSSADWPAIIVDEISRFCSAYFDQGMSSWSMSPDAEGLYASWREIAQVDRRPELLGLRGFRKLVASLPDNATDAITHLAESLGMPPAQRFDYLLAQLMSIPGWAAYTKYSDRMAGNDSKLTSELLGLLAIRMAYDYSVAQTVSDEDEQVLSKIFAPADAHAAAKNRDMTHIRYILQTAVEIKYREQLVEGLSKTLTEQQNRETAECQMVFCIDVRSEPFRRHIESQPQTIETFGFAGFFGIAVEVSSHDHAVGTPQCPVLLSPGVKAQVKHADPEMAQARADRGNAMRAAWKRFRSAAMAGFSFVESCGLSYIVKLTREALKLEAKKHHCSHSHVHLTEHADGNEIATSDKIHMAASILKNLGLTEDFARIVVFCGHGSETRNNPLAASLDCGACGGHAGDHNARLAADILNDSEVRSGLAQRGLAIPAETVFVAGLHNTTTDEVTFLDEAKIPASHTEDLQRLKQSLAEAAKLTRAERAVRFGEGIDGEQLLERSRDWSQVRPEWGLAGNAAMIVAPRERTKPLRLGGRVFLHSYDYQKDEDFSTLELIMTAPMVVANWINMQYFASTVDNTTYGCGNKALHNVVGGIGVLEGNSGDLRTGLPIQSLSGGEGLQHEPVRLQVFIDAPADEIQAVLMRHKHVHDLVTNGWLHLFCIQGEPLRYRSDDSWEPAMIGKSADA